MKTTDPRDPLNRKIDALLSEQPLRASEDFGVRALDAAEAAERKTQPRQFPRLLRFALPAAAAVALALFLSTRPQETTAPQDQLAKDTRSQEVLPAEAPIESSEIEELFRLQEGLSGLATIEEEALDSGELLQTLDALEYGFES